MKAAVVRVIGLFASVLVAGAAGAQSTQAVEWKVSEGGNGHWYAYFESSADMRWWQARDLAVAHGGHLATLTTAAEDAFVVQLSTSTAWPNRYIGPWLGAFATNPCSQGAACFEWVTGEQFSYARWHPGNPGDVADVDCPGITGVCLWDQFGSRGWQDVLQCHGGVFPSAVIEWDADCNNDGIVDYGQIKSGQLADDNANGIPDICETSVTGVIPPSVPSQGGSTIIINGRNFPAQPTVLVGGTAATNVVRVSDTRLTATVPAGLPGMRSITVNGFTLTDGIYYRPECGSDLDQNGIVDAGDISIILLEFGQCYETPYIAPADADVPPLLEAEPAPEAPGRR